MLTNVKKIFDLKMFLGFFYKIWHLDTNTCNY